MSAAVPAPAPADCRDIDTTAQIDGTTQHFPVRACRDYNGNWQTIPDDGYAGGPYGAYGAYGASGYDDDGSDGAYAPGYAAYYGYPWPYWDYPFGFSSFVSSAADVFTAATFMAATAAALTADTMAAASMAVDSTAAADTAERLDRGRRAPAAGIG
ncbi:MAG: hypothetical protein WDN30_03940 [Pararobbsia sp.]